jgi:energy-coupling factor transporter ATP-binding protein EcfA2
VAFDPRFTVITGANQTGKSTLAEALHRALFLPVKTGGTVLDGMKTDPFVADPEVELSFECGGERWNLRKRFAGTRGSVSLQDSSGRSRQGDEAEDKLAELIGTAAVARTRAAADQLKERWGHLWVWQGSSSSNPFGLSTSAYDHDRLVERLQAGAELSVQSPLDLAVLDDIQRRWGEVYTPGGANRAPQVRRGSALQLARAAVGEAQDDLALIEADLAAQQEAQNAAEEAAAKLAQIAVDLPQRQQERQSLAGRLTRSQELKGLITQQRPLLESLGADLQRQQLDHKQLEVQSERAAALDAVQAPKSEALESLRQQVPELEGLRDQNRQQLVFLQQATAACGQACALIEQGLERERLQFQRYVLAHKLTAVEQVQQRLDELERDLSLLPVIGASDVEQLRRLLQGLQSAEARTEAMAAGIEVIRAGQPVRLGGEALHSGTTRMLIESALLQVGDDVELRLLPGGGTTASEARQQREVAQSALELELRRWKLGSVEDAATAERRRSDLLAERERLLEQRGQQDPAAIRQRVDALEAQIVALPTGPEALRDPGLEPEERIAQLEKELQAARGERELAAASERDQQRANQESDAALDQLKAAIAAADQDLRNDLNQLLEARTLIDAVLQRCGSLEALQAEIAELSKNKDQCLAQLNTLEAELTALDPITLERLAGELDLAITVLQQQERDASDDLIRAEGRLKGDGRVDLKAEFEQKQAELESRVADQERLEKEAGMLTLLRQLLEEEQNAMASQYTAPLTERIGAYLAHVFPESPRTDLTYDARGGFGQLQWRRGNEAAFAFEVLSTGAREQFAAALRVAIAEVLADAYDGTLPLLFDDAFANSDPERQVGVCRMLQEAANQGLQVILLTCDPAAYGSFAEQVVELGTT